MQGGAFGVSRHCWGCDQHGHKHRTVDCAAHAVLGLLGPAGVNVTYQRRRHGVRESTVAFSGAWFSLGLWRCGVHGRFCYCWRVCLHCCTPPLTFVASTASYRPGRVVLVLMHCKLLGLWALNVLAFASTTPSPPLSLSLSSLCVRKWLLC